jgi:hypothetical protein
MDGRGIEGRDVEGLNARWLRAWTDKDVDRLVDFYAQDTIYRDPQVPDGLRGRDALRAYLEGLFAATPPMTYEPDEVWPTATGWCGRWICRIDLPDGAVSWLRGFDLVVLDGERIALNEVYTHTITEDPRPGGGA